MAGARLTGRLRCARLAALTASESGPRRAQDPDATAAAAALRSRGAAQRGTALGGASEAEALRRDVRRAAEAEAMVQELQRALAAARDRLRRAPRAAAG